MESLAQSARTEGDGRDRHCHGKFSLARGSSNVGPLGEALVTIPATCYLSNSHVTIASRSPRRGGNCRVPVANIQCRYLAFTNTDFLANDRSLAIR